LLEREGINRTARVREVRVSSVNLKKIRALTHFVIAHWWVRVQDSDGNWWTAENVGSLLLQRVGNKSESKKERKRVWKTSKKLRPGRIARRMNTSGNEGRSMEEVVEWMFGRRMEHYNPVRNNCQKFASDLTKYLSGIEVARTPPKLAPAAYLLGPVWKIVNIVRGRANRRKFRRLAGE
jgi:hypothetical protein